MTTSALVQEGLHLMALGMGAVFVFLTLLIVSMLITARSVRAIEARRQTDAGAGDAVVAPPAPDPELIAAVSTAIRRYRMTHGR